MRILALTPQLPFPPMQGTTLRNFYLLRELAQRHEIAILSFLQPGDVLAEDEPLPCRALFMGAMAEVGALRTARDRGARCGRRRFGDGWTRVAADRAKPGDFHCAERRGHHGVRAGQPHPYRR